MLPPNYRLLHGMPSVSFSSLRLCGYSDPSSNESAGHRATERPPLIHRDLGDGTLRFGEPDGGSEEWIDAEATVSLEHAR